MIEIDQTFNITCNAYDPLIIRWRWAFADGTPREVPGDADAFGWQIFGNGVENGQVTAFGTLVYSMVDGVEVQCVETAHPPATGPLLARLPALRWRFGEVLPSGLADNQLSYEPFITVRGVPDMEATPPLVGNGRIRTIVFKGGA